MNLLLDTHVFIWWMINDPGLSSDARNAIINPKNTVYVSAVSAWEISIKKALGKLSAPDNLEEELVKNRFKPLVITIPHAQIAGGLPPIHNDPFDRLLIAQAQVEGFTLVTRDKSIQLYSVKTLEA